MKIRISKPDPQTATSQSKRLKRLSKQTKIPKNAALVVIDMQKGFDDQKWGNRNNPDLSTKLAANLGFITYLVSDATCTFDRVDPFTKEVYPAELVHRVHLASLNNEFAKVINTKSVLELLE